MRMKMLSVLCCGLSLMAAADVRAEMASTDSALNTTAAATATGAVNGDVQQLVIELSKNLTAVNDRLNKVMGCNSQKQFLVGDVCVSPDVAGASAADGGSRWIVVRSAASCNNIGARVAGVERCKDRVIAGARCDTAGDTCWASGGSASSGSCSSSSSGPYPYQVFKCN